MTKLFDNTDKPERVLLCAVYKDEQAATGSLRELSELCRTAGGEVVFECIQRLDKPVTATMVGSGKLEEIAGLIADYEIDTIIFDNELSGIQLKNIENATGAKTIDRSTLILDIFAQRATSIEGKLQVELAQLKYSMPRLIGSGGKMSKMRSGIGMRGPGETKLETDRRIIKRRVFELEERIKKLAGERELRRKKRENTNVKTVALVGYTNAGKSTLLNALAKEKTLAKDMLFATLDPITRKVYVSDDRFYVITDTVGFINKLPHEFIDAFSSTLEEARSADILLHVMDASSAELDMEYDVVMNVLERLSIINKRIISVYNKTDKADGDILLPCNNLAVKISAKYGDGMEELKKIIDDNLFPDSKLS